MMRTFVWLVVAPFAGACLLGLSLGMAWRTAQACECVGDSFWVVQDVTVEGAAADFPTEGHLYPDRLKLWAEGFQLALEYAP